MDTPVRVINLLRSADRREEFSRANAHLDFQFVPARDGTTLTEAQLHNPRHFIHPLRFPSLGAYGCALSHLEQWDVAIASGRPVTVAEDDAVFRHDFRQASAAMMALLPEDWDFVLWGWNTDSVMSLMSMAGVTASLLIFDHSLLCENIATFQALTTRPFPLPIDRCLGIPAYTISPKGARRFKEECFPMKHFEMFFPVLRINKPNDGVDVAMARTYSVSQSFAAFPPLVATKNEGGGKSTIQPA